MLRNRKGFTLIELLIVVLVIGILSALVWTKFGPVREKAYVAGMKNTLHNLVVAQEQYFDANDVFVDAVATLSTGTGFTVDDDVSLAMTALDAVSKKYGFWAIATHAKTSAQCGIEYGATAAAGTELQNKVVCSASGVPTGINGS